MKSALADLIFILQFSVAPLHLEGISVISELTPNFIWWSHLQSVFTHVASIYANLLEKKESVCIRKEFNSHRTGLGRQHGRRFIVLGHQYGRCDIMWKHSIIKLCVDAHVPDFELTTG